MHLDYTSDNICKVMGLLGFREDRFLANKYRTLRTIFMPSFHPEVCITIQEPSYDVTLSVTSLKERFWGLSIVESVTLPRLTEGGSLPKDSFDVLADAFTKAEAGSKLERKSIFVDGMSIASILAGSGNSVKFKEHIWHDASIHQFARTLILACWDKCNNPTIKNSLSCLGGYVGLELPKLQEPPEPYITRLMVLGSEEEREAYLNALETVKSKLSSEK